jgi:integrase
MATDTLTTSVDSAPSKSRKGPRAAKGPRSDWRQFVRPAPERMEATIAELVPAFLARVEHTAPASFISASSVVRAQLVPAFGEMSARELGTEDLIAWMHALRVDGYAECTIGQCLAWLRLALDFAVERGAAEENPTRRLLKKDLPSRQRREPLQRQSEVLDPATMSRILFAPEIPLWRRAMYATLMLAGLRIGEACALRWSDLEADTRPLARLTIVRQWAQKDQRVRETKTKRPRRMPVHPVLLELLQELREDPTLRSDRGESTDLLLVVPSNQRSGKTDVHWKPKAAMNRLRRDLELLGIRDPAYGRRTLHGLRHSFITNMIAAGAPERLVRAMTHTSTITDRKDAFQLYVHAPWKALCAAMMLLQIPRPGEVASGAEDDQDHHPAEQR